jgi:hypothetical protein
VRAGAKWNAPALHRSVDLFNGPTLESEAVGWKVQFADIQSVQFMLRAPCVCLIDLSASLSSDYLIRSRKSPRQVAFAAQRY